MAIWMAVLLAAAGVPPEDDKLPRSLQADESIKAVEGIAGVRLGVWTGRGFDFVAVRTDATQASSDQQALITACAIAGVQLYERFNILVSYEGDIASKVSAGVAGAYLGWREHPKEKYGKGVPDEVLVYAGAVTGSISVDAPDFGGFKRGVGYSVGLSLGWSISALSDVIKTGLSDWPNGTVLPLAFKL